MTEEDIKKSFLSAGYWAALLFDRRTLYGGLTVSIVLFCLLLKDQKWHGSFGLHSTLEITAAVLALMVGILSLLHYYTRRDNIFLFLGVGFLGAACLDGYHTFMSSEFIAPYLHVARSQIFAWTEISSRWYLSILLAMGWYMHSHEHELGAIARHSERIVYYTMGIFILFCFLFFASAPLPKAYFPDMVIHRPADFIPGLFFLIALTGYLREGAWASSSLIHWLILSFIFAVLSQTIFMPFSESLLDAKFNFAHILKIMSYLSALIGLLIYNYQSYLEFASGQEHVRAVIHTAIDGIIIVDQHGIIQSFNPAAESIFGYNASEVIGRHVKCLMPIHLAIRYDDFVADYNKSSEPHIIGKVQETQGQRKDGTSFPIELGVSEMFPNSQKKYLGFCRDISERNEAARDLSRTMEKLYRSNKALEQFTVIASHDLQEPLRKIRAFSNRFYRKYAGKFDSQGEDYLNRMVDAAKRMETLIKDLLIFSRVSSRERLFSRVNLSEIVAQVCRDNELLIAEVDAHIEVLDLPEIDADPTQMHQLFQNLIGNGLKYRHAERAPHIRISADIMHSDQTSDKGSFDDICQITIEDNGIGFDNEYADHIFGIFQRLHGRETHQGTGIGLAICSKIVEHHDGRITASARTGEGAIFRVVLPVKSSRESSQ